MESRNDIGPVVDGSVQQYGQAFVSPTGEVELAPITITAPGCRVYVAVSQVDGGEAWIPQWPDLLDDSTVYSAPGHGSEGVRLAVASGTPEPGTYPLVLRGLPAGFQVQIVAWAMEHGSSSDPEVPGQDAPPAETRIEAENRRPGSPQAEWDVVGAGDPSIQGFATSMHVNASGALNVKVHSPSAWGGTVYRLGWYGGLGARQVDTFTGTAVSQPSGTVDAETLMVSCANWSVNGVWQVPSDAVPGVYVIRVALDADRSTASHIGPFVVADPSRKAAVAVKLSDSTWQAYNHAGADPSDPFRGRSIYGSGTAAGFVFDDAARSKAVSYDRPLVTRQHVSQTSFWNAEYPLLRWLERLGVDVDYLTCAQVDADPTVLHGRQVVVSSGHDEYWSAGMVDAWKAARDMVGGPHQVWLSGNDVFWRIRWDADRRAYACWKDTLDGQLNPTGEFSGTWQDTRGFNTDRRPAALLNGQRFRLNGISAYPLAADSRHAGSPFWRDTAVADLTAGQTWTSPAHIVGFEANEPADVHPAEAPHGLIRLSEVTRAVADMIADDNGATYTNTGDYTHAITAFRSAAGVVVWHAGTVQYAWALDDTHDRNPGSSQVSVTLQQALLNLLADLGVQPPEYPLPETLRMPAPVPLTAYGFPAPPVDPDPDPGPDPDPDPEPDAAVGMVRLLAADLATPPLFTDTQIRSMLAIEGGNVKRAAALVLETTAVSEVLIGKKITTQDLSTDSPAVAAELRARAKTLRDQAQADDDATAEADDGYGFDVVHFDQWAGYRRRRW
ncbi:N,N-dimethylformamidase beta subunit family domain-containing protein [Melissospora conviva]|uniref:N,N-dimethylformamidase beta subunit family domain-containing protein n=1 Tax=Melissospora conviva TaxID=3388432 RepID=UPI003C1FC23F